MQMLTANGRKQEISYIYLHALATRLGYSLERTSVDMDSVDATICSRGKIQGSRGILHSPKIDIQLKATEKKCSGDHVSFPLSKKNYDDLRKNTMVPKILVVLFLPEDDGWFDWHPDKILLYAKAYWASLKGMGESENDMNVTIQLSENLTHETIQQWMIAAANREDIAYASC